VSETLEFFRTLFEYKPEGSWILVWAVQGPREKAKKVSHWCATPEEAAATAERLAGQWDLYFGVGLAEARYQQFERLKKGERNCLGIFGMWADIDFAGEEHTSKVYPPDLAAAERLIGDLNMPPTVWVHSGHGLQCEWVFKEPWIFETPEERERARGLCAQWKKEIQRAAKGYGWAVDSVADLERVMRVPGTVNLKGEPVPTRMLRNGGPVYTESDFIDRLPEPDPFEEPAGEVRVGKLALRRDAEPPLKKLWALQENDPKFRQSMRRERRDFPSGKNSPSEYDLSLAAVAVMAGWTDQEIADLIIFARVQNSEDVEKVLHGDQIAGAILKARRGKEHEEALNDLETAYAAPQDMAGDERQALVKGTLTVEVTGVRKIMGEPPEYVLRTAQGDVHLGNVDGLISQTKLRNSVASVTGRYIPLIKAGRWKVVAQALLDMCVEEETGPDTTDAGMVASWVGRYLESENVGEPDELTLKLRKPFSDGGATFIFVDDLRDWIRRRVGDQEPPKRIGKILKCWGAAPRKWNCSINGKATSRWVWQLPNLD
jgi:hypothetical protein